MPESLPVSPPPGWTCLDDGTYVRPLVGPEVVMSTASLYANGHTDVAMGYTFTTNIPDLADGFVEALIRLRMFAPLVAADIVPRPEHANALCWSYQPLRDYEEAKDWATATLHVHTADASPPRDVIHAVHQTSLPWAQPNGRKQYFSCHLFVGPAAEHALIIYGTHALIEGQSGLWVLRFLLSAFPAMCGAPPPEPCQGGTEVANLPVSMDDALSAPAADGTAGADAIRLPIVLQPDTANLGLLLPLALPTAPGRAVRVTRTVDARTFARVRAQLRADGLTVTTLLDAAKALALAELNAPLPRGAQVASAWTPIALQRFLRAPYAPEAYITTCLTAVPLFIPLGALPPRDTTRARVLAAARVAQRQYAAWLASPDLLATARQPPMPAEGVHTACPSMSNLGELERCVPRVWTQDAGGAKRVLELTKFEIGMKVVIELGSLVTHAWTLGGTFSVQIQAPDTYDAQYLGHFMDRMVAIMLSILDEE